MKQQKTKKTSTLEQASTLLNKIDDSQLQQVAGGCLRTQYTNPDPNSSGCATRAV